MPRNPRRTLFIKDNLAEGNDIDQAACAQSRWRYSPEDAERTQVHMIENAFEVAKRADQEKGLEIVIEGSDG